MNSALYDQIYLVPVARKPFAKARPVDAQMRLAELEFSQKYRNPRLSAGWFLLPGAALALPFILTFFL